MVAIKKELPIIVWDERAYFSFEKACNYIKEDSLANAEQIKITILSITQNLSQNPEKYPRDKYKFDNPGNYRVFEKYRFRISYKHTAKEIRILRFRSTDQEPILY